MPSSLVEKDAAAMEEVEMRPDPKQQQSQHPVTDDAWRAADKSLTRKLDMTLMPMVWILYLFNYLDRNNIAQAKLNSFEADLGLKGNQFNTAVSLLNVSYMLMQIPSNMLLTRFRPSLYIASWVTLWSVISALTALADSYTHLIVIRIFLGLAEAPFFPGAVFILGCWYPKRLLARRTAVLYSGLIIAQAFSGLIAAGVLEGLDGVRGLAGWRWLFIIEGAASCSMGLLAFLVLPDFPGQRRGGGLMSKFLLTEQEHKVAVERMSLDRSGQQQQDSEVTVWSGFRLAVRDPKMWVFTLMLLANHSAYGFTNFFPSIVQGFGFGSTTITLVLTAPPYLVAALTAYSVAWSSDVRQERGYHISLPQIAAMSGFIISAATTEPGARYFAAFLYCSGCFASNALVFSWASNTLGQTAEKRAVSTAIINVVSQFGNIYSPYFFPDSDEPRYVMAMCLMLSFSALSVLTCAVMKWMLTRENREILLRAAAEGDEGGDGHHVSPPSNLFML